MTTADFTLKELTRAKYSSLVELSMELGWSYSKTHRIVNGVQEPTRDEIRDLAEALGISSAHDLVSVFSLL